MTKKKTVGHSYKDPIYDTIEAKMEKKYGLPAGLMKGIRVKGERSNADQVSPVGARTVYQIMPNTRGLFKKAYGVDAYSGLEGAAEVAALHLRDDIKKTGSTTEAVRRYIGGPDPSQHGKQTAAYVQRVTGVTTPAGTNGAVRLAPGLKIEDFSVDDILNMRPEDLGNTRRPLGPDRTPKQTSVEKREARNKAITGGVGVLGGPGADTTPELGDELQREADGQYEQAVDDSYSFTDRFEATMDDWIGSAVIRAISETNPEAEEGYHDWYTENHSAIEDFALDAREVDQLRETNSQSELMIVQGRMEEGRQRDRIQNSGGYGMAWQIAGGLLDPAGWAAGAGVSKGFQLAKVGSGALAASGKTGKAVASLSGEAALGNLAFTAGLDAAGEYTTPTDYVLSGVAGLGIGALMSPLVIRAGRLDTTTTEMTNDIIRAEQRRTDELTLTATNNLPDTATPEQVLAEVDRLNVAQTRSDLELSLAPVPDNMMFLSPDELLTADKSVLDDVSKRANLEGISDDAERGLVAEMLVRGERMVKENPIDEKATNTSLRHVRAESTGITMLRSPSDLAKATSMMLLEGTTGASGRRRTAAMSMVTRERLYNRPMQTFDSLHQQFRKSIGVSYAEDLWNFKARKQFNNRVMAEIEARHGHKVGVTFDENPFVVKAADNMEHGFAMMKAELQHVDAVGSARLGPPGERGYFPHKLDIVKVMNLTPVQQRSVRKVLADQFVDGNDFDRPFSEKLAVKYLEQARARGKGSFDVPFNLHSPEAADIVRDSLAAMKLGEDEIERLMGKFSRGGANFTKKRLKLDLNADIGEGMVLRDLFNQDVTSLYRGYARRAAGEVALAQYGIMGKKGLNVLRKGIQETGGTGADIRAFDQIAAEFLNTPFGEWNHAYMDNLRIATSAARLGGMGFTQAAEYGNAIAAIGVQRMFSSIGSFGRLRKEIANLADGQDIDNPILNSLDLLGGHLGLDDHSMTRAFDIKDNSIELYNAETLGVFSRALRGASHLQSIVSGHRMIMSVQTRGMAEQIIRKAAKYIKDGKGDAALDDMGITADLREAVRRNLDNIATFDAKGNLMEFNLKNSDLSGHEMMSIRDAVERGASQIIQRTYTGETGAWAHSGFLKMLLQFRTFSITAVEKQWGRNMKNHGAIKSFAYLTGAASFAVPIYLARMQLKMAGMSDKERRDYADKYLTAGAIGRATLNYASSAGLLGDILDIGGGFASSFGGDGGEEIASYVGARGGGRGQLLGDAVAPGLGLVEDLWKGIHGDGKKLVKALPGSNLPYIQPLVNGITSD